MVTNLVNLPHLKPANIYCIGRNYAEHALELNNPIPDDPIIFSKPTSSLLAHNGTVMIPAGCNQVHHEAELVVAIGKHGKDVTHEQAFELIAGIAAGIDVTARDIQSQLKSKSLPWLLAKGLDTFAPVGPFFTDIQHIDYTNLDVTITVNGEQRQNGNTRLMLFPVSDLIVRLSAFFTLQPGDLIYTGTPAGVGPLLDGDTATASVISNGETVSKITVNIRKKR